MGEAFDIVNEIEVGATPEQAWQAIATGEGMDGWFMGRVAVLRLAARKQIAGLPCWLREMREGET